MGGAHDLEFILAVPVALRDIAEVRVEGLGALDRVGPELADGLGLPGGREPRAPRLVQHVLRTCSFSRLNAFSAV